MRSIHRLWPVLFIVPCILVSSATARPAKHVPTPTFAVELAHHKPWHKGGPPWLRRDRPAKNQNYVWERQRGWVDQYGRRGEYRVEEWTERRHREYRYYSY